jgi:hypothetical protein
MLSLSKILFVYNIVIVGQTFKIYIPLQCMGTVLVNYKVKPFCFLFGIFDSISHFSLSIKSICLRSSIYFKSICWAETSTLKPFCSTKYLEETFYFVRKLANTIFLEVANTRLGLLSHMAQAD